MLKFKQLLKNNKKEKTAFALTKLKLKQKRKDSKKKQRIKEKWN